MKVRIAVVQFEIAQLDREKNIERIEKFIKRAARQGAQVIVFPEDCLTGSIFGVLSRLDTTQAAQRTFQEFAMRYNIDIVTGSSMEGTSRGNFNTSYYINADGHVLGMYRKNHLYPSERSFLKAGDDVPVFETAFGKAGIVICWDMLFPEIFQRMKAKGVQLIYCPSYWYREIAESMAKHNPSSEEEQVDALCMTRALETNAVLTYCNAAGIASYENGTKDTLIGHSQIVMPVLGAVRKLRHQREAMFIQEVDVSLLTESRKIYQA
ncbi:MAG: carbon-nitrogen hydrolase family protein [Candidatus Uhrbacteria bacterium]|nr:carbon-nitrogen hydrolase family protein [Candidatus Uhrbacteria bacterium]